MRRVAGANTIELSPGKLGFRGRDTDAGVPGTVLTADWHNDVQEEMCAVIEGVGLAPSADRTQLLQAIRALGTPYAVDSGAANALVVNVNRPGWSLAAGATIRVKVAQSVIDDATINIRNGAADLGTFPLIRPDGSALSPYDLAAGQIATLIYDGASVQIPRVEGKTGDPKIMLAGASLAGHVALNGLTIGAAGSGATGRAAADCRKLYVYLYDTFSDAICPVTAGRGLNAAADWAAGKPIKTPDTRCRSLIGVDGMGGAGVLGMLAGVAFSLGDAVTPGAQGGAALHALIEAELAAHDHPATDPGHAHAVTDPGHAHSVTDPGHAHKAGQTTTIVEGTVTPRGAMEPGADVRDTTNAATGIGIVASVTGINVVAATTGIDVGDAGGGQAHNNMPPFLTVAIFARL